MNITIDELYTFPLDLHNDTAEGSPITKKPFKYIYPYSEYYYQLRNIIYNELVATDYTDYDVVYRIEFADGKSYIGQSKRYATSSRIQHHIYLLHNYTNVKYSGKKVNTAIKEVGIKYIQILKKYNNKDNSLSDDYNIIDNSLLLNEVERYYIMLYDSVNNGYNSKKR